MTAAAVALATGCASTPAPAPAPAPAPQVRMLPDYMSEAAKAKAERLTTKERETYRAAASVYPTAKEPWVHLAESYFEAGDYGNAILAAQEVLQRDGADQFATGVLAVSGLRVSTQALAALGTQSGKLPTDSRTEAESLTKKLRELLGERDLVPKPTPQVTPPRRAPQRPASTTTERPTQGSQTQPAPVAKPPVVQKDDPFKSLR